MEKTSERGSEELTGPYKDVCGRYRTVSLFSEFPTEGYSPIYTLSYQSSSLPSLPQLYLSISDPTEYEFAQAAFGSWEQWEKICGNKLLSTYIEKWRAELAVKLKSEALIKLKANAEKGDTGALKYLANEEYKKQKAVRGRPSKEEVEGEKKRMARESGDIESHYDRMLKVVK